MKILLSAAILIAVAAPAHAEKDISDAELHAVWSSWQRRCADFAVAENRPSLEKDCINGVKSDIKELDAMRADPQVTDVAWDTCRMESGFGYNGDFHGWAACLRVAKTRRGLK